MLFQDVGFVSVIQHAAVLVQLDVAFAHAKRIHQTQQMDVERADAEFSRLTEMCVSQARWVQTAFVPSVFQSSLRLCNSFMLQYLPHGVQPSRNSDSLLSLLSIRSLCFSENALSRSSRQASAFFRDVSLRLLHSWAYPLAAAPLWSLIAWPHLATQVGSQSLLPVLGAAYLPKHQVLAWPTAIEQYAQQHMYLRTMFSNTTIAWIQNEGASIDSSLQSSSPHVFQSIHRHLADLSMHSSESDPAQLTSHPLLGFLMLLRPGLQWV
jgi:hypothetical protein